MLLDYRRIYGRVLHQMQVLLFKMYIYNFMFSTLALMPWLYTASCIYVQ